MSYDNLTKILAKNTLTAPYALRKESLRHLTPRYSLNQRQDTQNRTEHQTHPRRFPHLLANQDANESTRRNLSFKFNDELQDRFEILLQQRKQQDLTPAEQAKFAGIFELSRIFAIINAQLANQS
jgi:hypothetical protein